MSDYLKSALGYLNGGANTNEFVGQVLEINNVKLKVNRLIAEGGWALVFAVEDVATGKEYALKRLIAVDEEANKSIIQEIETLKKLSGHPNVIQYMCAQRVERDDKRSFEYMVVTELCPGGTLADLLRNLSSTTLTLPQACRIAYQATRAVHHMHSQQPQPIIHWDIKLENFLIANDGIIKLCDFGSASSQQILPNPSWNAQKRANLEEHMARFTTPMYRSPEMTDTWNNEPIGPPADCWALGCIFYTLVTLRHPFSEGNKLAIVNARYTSLPANPTFSCMHELIKGCLEASPIKRMTTSILLERLAAIAESNNFDLREPAKVQIKLPPPRPAPPIPGGIPSSAPSAAPASPPPRPTPPSSAYHQANNPPPPRPAPSYSQKAPVNLAPSGGSGLFSSLRGGAGSLLKNIKDTSSKVMYSVHQSIARTELDVSYLTSRILIMPYPADGIESAYRANHVEDARAFLQSRHPPPSKIQLYNLSRGRPNVSRLPGKHIDCSFAYAMAESNAPLLSALYQLCQDIYKYLDADFNHIVVLYCTDGCRASATVACALLLYAGVFTTSDEAVQLFLTRRCQSPILHASELRSINYMSLLHSGVYPHTRPIVLKSLSLEPIPIVNRAKDGCRPYVEVHSNGALVYSTKRPQYEEMSFANKMSDQVFVDFKDTTVLGDITIIVLHARLQLGRVIGIKIATLHFHTGFVPVTDTKLIFDKNDIDNVCEVGGKYKIILDVKVDEENTRNSRIPAPWEVDVSRDQGVHPDPLFGSTLEMEETLENFRKAGQPKQVPGRPPLPTVIHEEIVPEEIEPEAEPLNQPESHEEFQAETFAEADLLNLGMPSSNSHIDTNAKSEQPDLDIFSGTTQNEGDNIFSEFASFNQPEVKTKTPEINPPTNDLLGGNNQPGNGNINDFLLDQNPGQNSNQGQKPNDLLFDPFSGGNVGNNVFGNWTNSSKPNTQKTPTDENFPRNSSVPNFAAQNQDPFANLAGSMGASLNASWNGTPRESNTPQSASPATAGTPIHSSPRMQNKSNIPSDLNATETSVFGSKPATKSEDAFGDLLGSQGYNFFSSRKTEKDCAKTINQMRKVEAAKTMDPDKLKVSEWTEGKKSNLRALLCSLHTVLWPEADRWQRYEMHQLVTAVDVKKAYRKACLAVHPDKQAGTANENIAKLIFMELNNAWSAFENDATQQNLFS